VLLKEKGQVIVVNCKRCCRKMPKWKRSAEIEVSYPFPFDSIFGLCITEKEIRRYYPVATSHRKKL
jgi:ribosomal protein S26